MKKAAASSPSLPKLIVPKGRVPARTPAPQPSPAAGASLKITKAQVFKIVEQDRPVEVVLPWATLSANKGSVAGRAELTIWHAFAVCFGTHNEIKLSSGSAGANAALWIDLPSITPGQLFVVVVNGWCGGSGGVLRYETKTGSADVAVSGQFSIPVAVTDTDDDALLVVKIKNPPSGALAVKTVEVWKVD